MVDPPPPPFEISGPAATGSRPVTALASMCGSSQITTNITIPLPPPQPPLPPLASRFRLLGPRVTGL